MAASTEIDRAPRAVYNWKIYLASMIAAFGGALFGYDNAFFSGTLALPSFRRRFGFDHLSKSETNTLSSNIVITFQAGCLLACVISLPSIETFGRKLTMVGASMLFTLGAAIQLIGSVNSMYAGRFLAGLGVGPLTVVCPLYLSEVAPAAIRGRCIGFFEIAYQVGGVLGFWIGYGVNQHISPSNDLQWRIPVAMQIVLIGILLLGSPVLSETPRFLIKTDKTEQAQRVLSYLRNLPADDTYLLRELRDIQLEIQTERHLQGITSDASTWSNVRRQASECLKPHIARRVSCGVFLQFISQLSGVNGINYYAPVIFESLGVRGTASGLFATGIYGIVKFVTAIICYFWLIDSLGRRPLLLVSCLIMFISLFVVGTYIKIAPPDPTATSITGGGIMACAFIYIYVIGYVPGFGGIPWIMANEAVPLNVRGISATLGACTQWLFSLGITKATPYMVTNIKYGTFYFFGSCVLLGGIAIYFIIPETKGVPLEHMARAFGHEDVVDNQIAQDDTRAKDGVAAEFTLVERP